MSAAQPFLVQTDNQVKPFNFLHDISRNVDENKAEVEERRVWFEGRALYALISWPPGAEERAGVQIRHGSGEKIAPADEDSEYLFGDDFSHPFPLNEPIETDQTLVAEFINNDTQNTHLVNVIVMIEVLSNE